MHDAAQVRKRLKYSNAKVQRLKRKVKSLSEVVESLNKNSLISSGCDEILRSTFSSVPLAVMQRIMKQKSAHPSRASYPDELKSFALTLSFYSLKAYNYVRRTFQLALPHPSTLRQWYQGLNGQPGFTEEAYAALSVRVEEEKQKNRDVVCSLMFDEMAIRKQVEWDGRKFIGYVDVGSGVDDDGAPVATEVLVLMVVCVTGHWKVPLGYFLIDGMNGNERANIVTQCILKLHDVGVKVCSVTCDGPSCNFSMMTALGVNLEPLSIRSWFPHPADPSVRIYVVLDACHMLKLMRNCLASYGILVDETGSKINWNYVEQLHKLQQAEGLRLGNKLRSSHMMWSKQKMKVNIAAQTLSASVADAIEFCRVHLKLYQFTGSEATVRFLRLIDRLFDLLNSRNPLAKGYKAPMRPCNEHFWRPFTDKVKSYLVSLTDDKGTPMYKTKRRTPFVGLLCAIESAVGIYDDLVGASNASMKYLLTYKLSQDHIELFFGAVRSSCGSNNNPTVRQFIAAYKRLFMRHNVQGGLGNVTVQDPTQMLAVTTDSIKVQDMQLDTLDMSVARMYCLSAELQLPITDHSYAADTSVPSRAFLSEYKQAVVVYIAGYVVRMVKKKIKCSDCQFALLSPTPCPAQLSPPHHPDQQLGGSIGQQFVSFKSRGGLVMPSNSVVKVCEATEKCFQRMQATLGEKLPQTVSIVPTICTVVLQEVGLQSFSSLQDHMFDTNPENNHIFNLIKCISRSYCTIRMHHLAKQKTAEVAGTKVRKQLTKLVLFKGQ